MSLGLIAKSTVTIQAPVAKVWEALISPELIKKYMFGTEVISDWHVGSAIIWKGEWKGKPYEDRGTIYKMEKNEKLEVSHFSPLEGLPDEPENYHTLIYELSPEGEEATVLTLSQDNNPDEKAKEHSKQMWDKMLAEIKKLLEE